VAFAVGDAIASGALVCLGLSQDGQVMQFTVLKGESKDKKWVKSKEELMARCVELQTKYGEES